MLSDDFAQCIAKRRKKILIRVQNGSVEPELNHSLRAVYRSQFEPRFGYTHFGFCNVRRYLDNAIGVTLAVSQRIIGGLQPDFFSVFSQALDFPGD
jgi:hypothetical protein